MLQVFRWSSDPLAPSVYYRLTGEALVVVSEPIDDDASGCWRSLAANHVLDAACGGDAGTVAVSTFGRDATALGSAASTPAATGTECALAA